MTEVDVPGVNVFSVNTTQLHLFTAERGISTRDGLKTPKECAEDVHGVLMNIYKKKSLVYISMSFYTFTLHQLFL